MDIQKHHVRSLFLSTFKQFCHKLFSFKTKWKSLLFILTVHGSAKKFLLPQIIQIIQKPNMSRNIYSIKHKDRLILKLHMWIQCCTKALKALVVNCYKGENNPGNLNENKSINLYFSWVCQQPLSQMIRLQLLLDMWILDRLLFLNKWSHMMPPGL